jgi:hypothetical protein
VKEHLSLSEENLKQIAYNNSLRNVPSPNTDTTEVKADEEGKYRSVDV